MTWTKWLPRGGPMPPLLGGALALLLLAVPAAGAPVGPPPAEAAPSRATLDAALVGRWWAHPPKDNDCADFCVSHDEQYQFLENGQYLFADQHRDEYNSGDRFCVDARLYAEAGTWFTEGPLVYTTPTEATAEHNNTCDPSDTFRTPGSLKKTYIHWEVVPGSDGQPGLVLSNPLTPDQHAIYQKTG